MAQLLHRIELLNFARRDHAVVVALRIVLVSPIAHAFHDCVTMMAKLGCGAGDRLALE
ncbi:MAG: hypothetical protein ABIH03_09050 [Pseudomonadota bacterium]